VISTPCVPGHIPRALAHPQYHTSADHRRVLRRTVKFPHSAQIQMWYRGGLQCAMGDIGAWQLRLWGYTHMPIVKMCALFRCQRVSCFSNYVPRIIASYISFTLFLLIPPSQLPCIPSLARAAPQDHQNQALYTPVKSLKTALQTVAS
jgi:hypothetical protein